MAIGFIDNSNANSNVSAGVKITSQGGQQAVALGVMLNIADYGDAPSSYGNVAHLSQLGWTGGTLTAGTYTIFPNTTAAPTFALAAQAQPTSALLGTTVDLETTQPSVGSATGDDNTGIDDETSVNFSTITMKRGTTVSVPVAIGGAGRLNAWIDWNGDGDFADSGEQIATDQSVAAGTTLSVAIPSTAVSGTTFARFRICTATASCNTATGVSASGEVEDYSLVIPPPTLSLTKTSNGPWGAGQSGATYTLTPSNSAGTAATTGTVTVIDVLPSGITPNWTNPLSTNGWSCSFSGQTVTCTSAAVIAAGSTATSSTNIVLPVNVNSAVGPATNYASIGGGGDTRNGGVAPTPGAACTPSGMCTSVGTTILPVDYGEAPTSIPAGTLANSALTNSYKTLLAENGARHVVVAGVRLGATEVAETNGTPVAFGSDITASDNDGVQFNPSGSVANLIKMSVTGTLPNDVTVTASTAGYLNAWIDFDQSGTFDTSEQIFTNEPMVAGSNPRSFFAPSTTITGLTYARFRFTTQSGVATTSTGLASDGEVEDYAVKVTNILAPTSCVSSPTTTIGFNLRWFDAATSTSNFRRYQRVGTLDDGTLVDMLFRSTTAVKFKVSNAANNADAITLGSTQPLPGNQSIDNSGGTSFYSVDLYQSGTNNYITKKIGIINLLTDIDGTVNGSTGAGEVVGSPAPLGSSSSEHVAWHTSQVSEAQYSSNSQLYVVSNPFTGVANASAALSPSPAPYDSMAVGKYGNTVGGGSTASYPDATAKAVRLLTPATDRMDWLYYGGVFGTSNLDLNGSTSINLTCPDMGIEKTASSASVLAGNNYTYTLKVTNTTAYVEPSSTVTDTLPTGLTYVSSSDAGTYTYDSVSMTGKVTWYLGAIAAGATKSVTVTVTAPNATAVVAGTTSVINTANVNGAGDNISSNNSASAITKIGLATLTKTVRNVTRNTAAGLTTNGGPKDVLEYCLNYINKGGADLLNFVLTDNVPANLDAIMSNTGTGNNVSSTGYDTDANAAGFAGSGYGIQWTKGTTSYLTSSSSDGDGGSLTSSLLTLNVGTLVTGASGTACFRASIH